jgi:hypothetical protein
VERGGDVALEPAPGRVPGAAGHLDRVAAQQRALWGGEPGADANKVKVLVSRLRRKVEPPGSPPLLESARGAGYRLVVPGGPAAGQGAPELAGAAVA